MSGPEFVFGEPDEPSLEEALARAGGGEGMEGAFIDALVRVARFLAAWGGA